MKRHVVFIVFAVLFFSCSKDDGTDILPPESLIYNEQNVFVKNSAIVDLQPTVSGGVVTSYSISPDLPEGLSLNSTTGVISGTPTAFLTSTTYTVTASNAGGSASFNLTITVNDVAPLSLSYIRNQLFLVTNEVLTRNEQVFWVPESSGGNPTSYTISPALPAGLSINPTHGLIAGSPTTVLPTTTFTVTASNSSGSISCNLTITVNEMAPSLFSYRETNTFVKNYSLVSLYPNLYQSYHFGVTYSTNPALPLGLSINATTGRISGTPLVDSPMTYYTVTATNSAGSAIFNIGITVNNQFTRLLSDEPSYAVPGTGIFYEYEYGLIKKIYNTNCGNGRGCTSTNRTFYYSNVGIASYSISYSSFWGTSPPVNYFVNYTGDVITTINDAQNNQTENDTYDSSGRLIEKQIGSVHYTYEYYPDGNLYKVTDSSNSSNNKIYHSYDTKNNPLRIGGFTSAYLKLHAVPFNNPTAMNDQTFVYEYMFDYPTKCTTYRNGSVVDITVYNYQ